MAKPEAIKFNYRFDKDDIPEFSIIYKLKYIKNYLLKYRLFGINSDGLSYGNLSAYSDKLMDYYSAYSNKIKFIISASGTSGIKNFTIDDYTIIVDYDFAKNYLHFIGKRIASSESLTHAAIYNSVNNVKYVVHFHNEQIWSRNIHKLLTTDIDIEYGTPELAQCIIDLLRYKKNLKPVIILGGHPNGIIIWENNVNSLFKIIEELLMNI